MMKNDTCDALIIGAGPVGLAMAQALRLRGLSVSLCGQLPRQSHKQPDLRTAALFAGSVTFLENLGAWTTLQDHATALAGIRIIDATGKLLRAPEQVFSAADVGARELGYNIANPKLTHALIETLAHSPSPAIDINLDVTVARIDVSSEDVTATLKDGSTRTGRVAIAADGRNSMTRQAAGITSKSWDNNQAALTAHFEHALPHAHISTEIQTVTGPCTVVPLAGNHSSLVWMDTADRAQQRASLDDDAFIDELETRLAGLLGPIRTITARRVFPLSTMIADTFAANRVALIGEAAHAFPPIGAQGLNLGFRDAASLADHLADAKKAGTDPGCSVVIEKYASERWADINARTYGVDAFNRSLGSTGAGLLRGAVMHATNASPGIKRFLMERGLRPVGAWPSMMQ